MNIDKLLLVDKEESWTSFDVVAKIRNTLSRHVGYKVKVGHAGTLDPLATGLLVVAVGKRTKDIAMLSFQDKEYEGEIKLGFRTRSFDREYPEENERLLEDITEERVRNVAKSFVGEEYMQMPPMFSAVKQKGKRLYRLARVGKEIEGRMPRKSVIYSFDILEVALPFVSFRVVVSKGTYIRSLASDFGERLGVGAYLFTLRRTKVGMFTLKDAQTVACVLGRFRAELSIEEEGDPV